MHFLLGSSNIYWTQIKK
jgi:hypothetical protein